MNRRPFLAAMADGVVCFAFGRSRSDAAEFTYKLSTDVSADHPVTVRALEAAAKITAESGGRLEVRVFPNSTIGAQAQTLALLRSGALEFAINADTITESVVPVAGISATPFAFATHEDAWRTMDGPLGKFVHAALAPVGLYAFERSWDAGFRQMENNVRPINTVKDLQGLKMRVADSPIETALFKGLGASPTQVNGSEQYVALQTHLVDGTGVPLSVISTRKMYEVLKYASITNHMWTGYTALASVAAWQRLPDSLRELCAHYFDAAALSTRKDFLNLDSTLQTQLAAAGMQFNKADIPSFRAGIHAAGLYGQWRDRYGAQAWAMLEASVGPLR